MTTKSTTIWSGLADRKPDLGSGSLRWLAIRLLNDGAPEYFALICNDGSATLSQKAKGREASAKRRAGMLLPPPTFSYSAHRYETRLAPL